MPPLAGGFDARALRLACATALTWALLLVGWIGLGSLSQRLGPGPWPTFALLAGWVLVLGVLRVALASTAIGACGPGGRPGRAVAPAAAGALLAWLLLGDIGDRQALAARLMVGVPVAGVLLAVVLPRRATAALQARTLIGDCALPAGSLAAWRTPREWPMLLASAAMLPMMCGLPWMVDLCREDGLSAQGVLGVHLLAMFGPSLVLALLRIETTRMAPLLCAVLLVAGATALDGWGQTLAHGAAWSVAWHARTTAPREDGGKASAVLAASGLGAALVLLLGLGVSLAGPQAFGAWHMASAAAAAAGGCAMLVRVLRPHDSKKRRRIVQAREAGVP
ncbi:hypothetical protein [Variovorax sp. J31P207]|uniref:hypothetical protein n=1 Tax=Variovorax sp. J31P207 TaxID=3053510 RepID=UPI0025754B0E|nr:hypothetical protein [Variovorax sp. J31P207]MDM0071175.1 hypothetical protein [Variovorax sp. J31P207]